MRRWRLMSMVCASGLGWGCGDDSLTGDTLAGSAGTTTDDPTTLGATLGATVGSTVGPIDPTPGDDTTVGSVDDTTAGSADDTTTSPPTTGLDSSSSGPGFECGNDVLEADELCDGTELGGATCSTEGFDGGTLACASDCQAFVTSGCSTCGNVIVEADEPCDGVALLGQSCVGQGFDSGQIACLSDCSGFDTSACGTCGNGVRDGDEACDGADLGGETCLSQGLGEGVLGCLASCQLGFGGCELASGALLTVRTGDAMLRALDPLTLTFTDVGPLGVGFDFGEVAYDTTNGILWMIDGRPAESLYTVNMATGAATLVGLHGIEDLFGLAHDPTTNTLFGSGESPTGFYSLNPATGAPTFIGDPALAADGLTYDSIRDQIVALAAGGGELYSINRVTGAPTILSSAGFIDNCGLAHDPFQDVYWAIDWSGNLYRYDPNLGYSRTLQLSGLGPYDGMTYVQGFVP